MFPYAVGANWTFEPGEESSSSRTRRKALEVEEKSSPMAASIQVEMAETMAVVRVDST